MQLEDCENRLSKRLNYKLDASKRKLLVWGSESDIKFVQSVVGTMVQAEAADQDTHQVAGTKRMDRADSKSHSLDDSDARQKPRLSPPADDLETAMPQLQRVSGLPFSDTKFLSLPRGPVKIVHVKELDLFLIRGRLGAPAEVEPNQPAQD
jgi:hypothetical protein